MASSSDNIFGITTTVLTVPVGATNALLIDNCPYAQSTVLKIPPGAAGFSLVYIFGVRNGETLTAAQMVSGYSNGWQLALTESISFDGSTRFYVCALGATATLNLMRGLSVNNA